MKRTHFLQRWATVFAALWLGLLWGAFPSQAQAQPAIDLEKATNGHDADVAPGPSIPVGDPVVWTYVVTNTGDVSLSDVVVLDDQGVAVSCPASSLDPGESMICTGSGVVVEGQYRNEGTAEGTAPDGAIVSDSDPSHYFGEVPPPLEPAIDLEKATNGHDADTLPGPSIPVGDPVVWTYVVTNTGEVSLSDVVVLDDQGVAVSCPASSLDPGESMTCTGSDIAVEGQYRNEGTAEGTAPDGEIVSDSDSSHYFGSGFSDIHLEKTVNGDDADVAPGPSIMVGDPVEWSYLVINTGDVFLVDVMVIDDQGVAVSCPKSSLAPLERMTCIGSDVAAGGQYLNLGTVTGIAPDGEIVSDSDPSYYFGVLLDSDGDGVPDDLDVCPDTIIPEAVPTRRLGINRWALVDDDTEFDTRRPRDIANGSGLSFTTHDTAGCSCEQIIKAQGLGNGHTRFGCSIGAMREWINLVNP